MTVFYTVERNGILQNKTYYTLSAIEEEIQMCAEKYKWEDCPSICLTKTHILTQCRQTITIHVDENEIKVKYVEVDDVNDLLRVYLWKLTPKSPFGNESLNKKIHIKNGDDSACYI